MSDSLYIHMASTKDQTLCYVLKKYSDPLGAPVRFVVMTYFIKSKSSLIKDIIILCTIKKEKKCHQLNHGTVFPDALEILFSNY